MSDNQPKPKKVFQRELYVDADYFPLLQMPEPEKNRTSRGSYERLSHALIGDCVFWGLEPFSYNKKIRVTVEVLEENEEKDEEDQGGPAP